ncbi:DUF72 domain-containing protein [Pyrobaculum neutrophilum]|uniref:DUF72 domain-containing protein n=1 Tax=Pyrobaculum neutrophilum (strain DSM 2338 / JCM 9278 / NBRC 100436 / V24Sta) TaxID=444157 RepID=B1Y8W1_PYRNV|nr:DUF72 domain-containing protein [Pyrobaculum neutrophilum]ACB40190.1 protein of unknown function DUF72 [Pyrobaculum neutrophilum V24Sta]
MEVFVGTSGWLYAWNLGRSLEWYVENSGLNAVELNASFYRIPTERQAARWAAAGGRLRWAVKVYRGVTHFGKLSEGALELLRRFLAAFKPLDPYVDFYLFQMPPSFARSRRSMSRVEKAAGVVGRRAAFEFRHPSWFSQEVVEWAEEAGFALVSIDSPEWTWVVEAGGVVYLRMHGRTSWYSHFYDEVELRDVAQRVVALRPARVYVFFNNDHAMLENARSMLAILKELTQ